MISIKQVHIYKSLFSKSFFFDKFTLKNVYQYPKIHFLELKFFVSSQVKFNKSTFSKIVLLFYLLTGQRARLLVKSFNLRNIRRKRVVGLMLTLHRWEYFFDFLIRRQLALMSSVFQSFLLSNSSTFTFEVGQKIQDDDILFQALKISNDINYQISLKSNSFSKSHFHTLLKNFKIPCKT